MSPNQRECSHPTIVRRGRAIICLDCDLTIAEFIPPYLRPAAPSEIPPNDLKVPVTSPTLTRRQKRQQLHGGSRSSNWARSRRDLHAGLSVHHVSHVGVTRTMTPDEIAKSAAVDIAGRVDAQPASTMVAIDIPALIAEGQALLTQLGNYLPYAVSFLKTLAAIWGGSKTGSG